jgi:exosome complex component RRP46
VQSLNSAQPPSQPLYVSSRAVAINAASLSILNAGSIGMKGVPVAVGIAAVPTHGKGKQRAYDDVEEDEEIEEVSYADKDVTLVLDPTRNEEQNASARICFGWAFGAEFSSGKGRAGQGGEENQDEDAECIYVESDGEFDAVTVSPAIVDCVRRN